MDYSGLMGYTNVPAQGLASGGNTGAVVDAWYRMQVQNAHLLQHLAVEHELNPIDLRALKFLGVDDTPKTPKDLAQFLEAGSSLVTAVINRLESRQFIGRSPNPDDRRSTLLVLESRGDRVVDQLRNLYGQALSGLLDHAHQDEIIETVREIEQGLRAAAN